MKAVCQLCGRAVEVSKWQGEYERLRSSQPAPFICESCQARVRKQALDGQHFGRPI